jgi:anti-sigma B factor antagonist
MPLTVNLHEKTTGVFTIYPEGSIDTNTYSILEKKVDQVLQSAATVIVFDMKAVEYMSSAGVRVILKAQKALKKKGKVILMNLQPQIKKVFEIINALPSMQVFTSMDELDRYLDQMQRKAME